MESVAAKKRKMEGRCSRRQPIPDDVISEVLVRLPVKSLLRFRCVSRSWRSLISDPHIIQSHRSRSQQHPLALVREWNLCGDGDNDNDGKATYVPTSGATLQGTHYDFPGFNSINDMAVRVFSSSPDLICIREDGSRCALLNPATRERVALPGLSSGNTAFLRHMGFGYVPSLRKFKVARVFAHVDVDHGSGRQVTKESCAVFTVGVDRSWRPARGPPFMIARDQMAFVNGALHMTPSTEGGEGLAALDLEREAWRVIPMPPGVSWRISGANYNTVRVREQRGLLFLDHLLGPRQVEVWAMKDYEKGGWAMEHRIHLERRHMPEVVGGFLSEGVRPVVIGEDGRILIYVWRTLLWFDPRDQNVAPFSPRGHSLVWPLPLLHVDNYLPLNGWD